MDCRFREVWSLLVPINVGVADTTTTTHLRAHTTQHLHIRPIMGQDWEEIVVAHENSLCKDIFDNEEHVIRYSAGHYFQRDSPSECCVSASY